MTIQCYNSVRLQTLIRPAFDTYVSAGFPSPADDYLEIKLDLNDLVDAGNPAVFYCRMSGDSLQDIGIFDNDLVIVNKSLNPKNGDLVIAVINHELTIRTFFKKGNIISLQPANDRFQTITLKKGMNLTIWGVVTHVTRQLT